MDQSRHNVVPSTRSLMELPADFLPKLAPYLGYVDRVNLGKVNHALQDEVNSWRPKVKSIELQFDPNRSILMLDEIRVKYENLVLPGERPTTTCKVTRQGRRSKLLKNASQMDSILRDVELIHRNQKAHFEKFEVYVTTGFEAKIIEKMGSLVPQIRAKSLNLSMHCRTGQEKILSSFQAGELESITFNDMNCRREECESHINLVCRLEQCQQAKRITIYTHSLQPAEFELEHLTRVEFLDLKFYRDNLILTIATVERWMRTLQLGTTDLARFKVEAPFDFQLEDVVRHVEHRTRIRVEVRGNTCRLNLPTAKENEYLAVIVEKIPGILNGTLTVRRNLIDSV